MGNTFYKLPNWKMNRYLDAVDHHYHAVMSRQDVRAFGVGYEIVGGKVTDHPVLTIIVDKNKKNRSNPLTTVTNGLPMPHSVIELDFSGEDQAATFGPLGRARREARLDTIVGGTGIRNPKRGLGKLGALGAIVFDKKTGKPMGLSAEHCLGTNRDEPIVQPPGAWNQGNFVAANEIGRLHHASKPLDAALFLLNEKRKYAPQMLGLNGRRDQFELDEPVRASLGMIVECAGFRTYARGRVMAYLWWKEFEQVGDKRKLNVVRRVFIDFLSAPTQSGDSGAVWVESKSKRPVCLHKGTKGAFAWGTCMLTLAEWGGFKFTESLHDHLVRQLGAHQVGFVRKGSGFLAFCSKPDQNKRLMIRQFDQNLKTIAQEENDEFPFSGVSPVRWVRPNKPAQIYACWQSVGDRISLAKMNSATKLGRSQPIKDGDGDLFRTRYKPSMAVFKGHLVIAFTDSGTGRITIAYSGNGQDWEHFEVSNASSICGPAITTFKNKLVVCWSDLQKRVNVADVNPLSNSAFLNNWCYIRNKQTALTPALAVGGNRLYLAYTSLVGELRVLESPNGTSWSVKHAGDTRIMESPSLFVFGNKLLRFRPVTDVGSPDAVRTQPPTDQTQS